MEAINRTPKDGGPPPPHQVQLRPAGITSTWVSGEVTDVGGVGGSGPLTRK